MGFNNSMLHLEYLSAVQKVFLIFAGEAYIIPNTGALKVPYIDSPEPQHSQYRQQRLIVYVEQFCVSNIC